MADGPDRPIAPRNLRRPPSTDQPGDDDRQHVRADDATKLRRPPSTDQPGDPDGDIGGPEPRALGDVGEVWSDDWLAPDILDKSDPKIAEIVDRGDDGIMAADDWEAPVVFRDQRGEGILDHWLDDWEAPVVFRDPGSGLSPVDPETVVVHPDELYIPDILDKSDPKIAEIVDRGDDGIMAADDWEAPVVFRDPGIDTGPRAEGDAAVGERRVFDHIGNFNVTAKDADGALDDPVTIRENTLREVLEPAATTDTDSGGSTDPLAWSDPNLIRLDGAADVNQLTGSDPASARVSDVDSNPVESTDPLGWTATCLPGADFSSGNFDERGMAIFDMGDDLLDG